MCVWVKLCSHGEMYLPAATSLHIHEQLRHSGKSAAVRWGNKCTNTILCLYISWQKISGKNPACCKNLCSNLAYLPPLSLTKYANVIGPPLLANAWIWPQENGVKGTYLNKCFFSYCKNDRRQSDYLFFLINLSLSYIAICKTAFSAIFPCCVKKANIESTVCQAHFWHEKTTAKRYC